MSQTRWWFGILKRAANRLDRPGGWGKRSGGGAVNSRQCVVRVRNKGYSIPAAGWKLIGCRVVTRINQPASGGGGGSKRRWFPRKPASTFSICPFPIVFEIRREERTPRPLPPIDRSRIESNYYFVESRVIVPSISIFLSLLFSLNAFSMRV